jgi:plastocyanin
MAVYFVLGSLLVLWGLGLAVFGLLRADFPPSGAAGRALVGVTGVLVAATLVALLVTTEREHPREEAAAEAAEQGEGVEGDQSGGPGNAPGTPTPPGATPEEQPSAPPSTEGSSGDQGSSGGDETSLDVTEDEFSIKLADGDSLEAGSYKFAVRNEGKIQHDLTVEGKGVKNAKTKLIDGGADAELAVKLKPGKYKLYCSVPGHEQAGMKLQVTVK